MLGVLKSCLKTKDSKEHIPQSSLPYCACGKTLESRDAFKAHVQQMHGGLFQKGSSHYITITSQIVLPVSSWQVVTRPPSNGEQSKPNQATIIKNEIYEEKPYKNTQKDENIPTKSKTIGKYRDATSTSIPPKLEEQKKNIDKIPPKNSDKELPIIKWNDFILIPNKACNNKSFYCGLCQSPFSNPEIFVSHCFDQCQQIQHPQSSHFIRLTQVIEYTKEAEITEKQQVQQDQKAQTVPRKYNKKKAKKIENILPHLAGIHDLIKNKQYQAQLFICGCGHYVGEKTRFCIAHLRGSHKEIIPDNSTHIFIRGGGENTNNPCFHKLRIQSEDQGLAWSCPCQSEKVMNKATFIKHVLKVHRGISLCYDLE